MNPQQIKNLNIRGLVAYNVSKRDSILIAQNVTTHPQKG